MSDFQEYCKCLDIDGYPKEELVTAEEQERIMREQELEERGIFTQDEQDPFVTVPLSEMNVRPLPCVMDENGMIRGQKVKLLLSKIDEELNELKQAIISFQSIDLPCVELCKNSSPGNEIAEEAADTITAITTLCEAFGIDAEMRNRTQDRVNQKNRARGRL